MLLTTLWAYLHFSFIYLLIVTNIISVMLLFTVNRLYVSSIKNIIFVTVLIFCLFNNIAVAAAHALEVHGLERVAIADFDVHHGNGTEEIFAGDERVLMVSTFQHPFYPYSGIDGFSERMVNVPLAAYSGGDKFRAAVTEHWLPALERFKPQMIFISAGFDAHRDDDMAMLRLVEADYAWVTQQLKSIADRYAQGRIVSMLEGGYELHALGRSVAAHLKVLGEF